MASEPLNWQMSAATDRGAFQYAIVGTGAREIITGTETRDVSAMLDLLALADTPLINKIGWGPESGSVSIEWISENLGPGYIQNRTSLISTNLSIVINSTDGYGESAMANQVQPGTVLYGFNSLNGLHELHVVNSYEGAIGAAVSITTSTVAATGFAAGTSIDPGHNFYILGAYANEGSRPKTGMPRHRELHSNYFTILRQDVQITGSMKNTDMYVIGREDAHQIKMRLKEMQRQREATAFLSARMARTTTHAAMMDGVYGFLIRQSGTHIDITTQQFTESALNTIVQKIWENGGRNLSLWGSLTQTAKFTKWDKNRIRTTVNEGLGGGHITHYLTEAGPELELHPLANFPVNIVFILDTSKIRLRSKKNRKAIMEKLGKMGDMDDWQILSEFSMEMQGYNLGQHGMFNLLMP